MFEETKEEGNKAGKGESEKQDRAEPEIFFFNFFFVIKN
jgi:hypothetical protein